MAGEQPINGAEQAAPQEQTAPAAAAQNEGGAGAAGAAADDDIAHKIFVGGVSWMTTEDGLRYYFEKYGEVESVNLMKDRMTGQPRGFGFVKFKDRSVISKCLTVATHQIDGRHVDVKQAVPREKTQQNRNATSTGPGGRPVEALKIFVGGLAPSVTEDDFKRHFEQYGKVTDAVVMIDRKTQRSRGFGFITYENEEGVKSAIAVPHTINEKQVEVKQAEPRNLEGGRGGGYG
eukprot:CAMPEP_0113933930 /NCGR_PEP_ID=MMETSP1339-20121228/1284_1 /TAXON_ID=94617 /ORGANISM="Fibrocapsa japonica" /LENGTH=232 /DNA_ID=CAMNT_0000935499 /DNA_START=150 /DNA_END=845 /DNA_ORIENTATION=+ /assembly_acc=CAM_ASM_000762